MQNYNVKFTAHYYRTNDIFCTFSIPKKLRKSLLFLNFLCISEQEMLNQLFLELPAWPLLPPLGHNTTFVYFSTGFN